jgi:hypothetical protein
VQGARAIDQHCSPGQIKPLPLQFSAQGVIGTAIPNLQALDPASQLSPQGENAAEGAATVVDEDHKL